MIKLAETKGLNIIINEKTEGVVPDYLREDELFNVTRFHESIDGYERTPLILLSDLSKELGVSKIFVKDESFRFGLNAFKALGATYAIFRILCEKLSVNIEDVDFRYFKSDEVRDKIKDMVFVTATDGNHGRAVAWAANTLGCKSIVYMPKGSSITRLENIRKEGAEAEITDVNYDGAVRIAKKKADEIDGVFVQDTALPGYEKIPVWISQGYTTMAKEAFSQMKEEGVKGPTHILLQAGVGAYAGGVLGYVVNLFKDEVPKVIILEPEKADCIFKSAISDKKEPVFVTGDMDTIMAGLACGEPNPLTWPVLRDFSHAFVSCPDYVAEEGMRILASPKGDDRKIVSGESGAVGVGFLKVILENRDFCYDKKMLGFDENSVVLCFSTEGDTDPDSYKRIINKLTIKEEK